MGDVLRVVITVLVLTLVGFAWLPFADTGTPWALTVGLVFTVVALPGLIGLWRRL